MRYFKIDKTTYRANTGGYDPEDEWSRDSTVESHNIHGLIEVGKNAYYDVCIAGEGDTFYLLYGIYGTGDSFGVDEGRFEEVSLHRDIDIARENKKRLEIHERSQDINSSLEIGWTVTLLNDDGSEFTYSPPWLGYFEVLTNIDIEKVSITKVES